MINKIHLGDSLKILKQIPSESIDLVVTDCPYKIIAGGVCISNPENNPSGCLDKKIEARARAKYISDGSKIGDKWIKKDGSAPSAVKDGKMFQYNDIKFEEWLPELYRVLKKGTHCYIMINGRNLAELQQKAEKAGFEFQNLLIWNKGNATPNKYYMQSAEFILMLSKRPARNINNMGTTNIFNIPNAVGKKEHPTQKPEQLLNILIENSSNKNDVVLEPFAGSGSTIVSCINLKRQYIGIEIDKKYYKIACEREQKAKGEWGLFVTKEQR